MPVSKVRSKTKLKLRNILRNNVKKENRSRVEEGFFPMSAGRFIIPWWLKPKQK